MKTPLSPSIASPPAPALAERRPDLPSISVVVPVFNGAKTLTELVRRIDEALGGCALRHEVVLVNDASGDESWATIEALAASNPSVRGFDLTRNYGQHNALLAGIREARYEVVVTIDDDLQNPPEEIPKLIAALTPDRDVVYGKPIAKRHSFGRRMATRIVGRTLSLLGGKTAPMVSAFRAFRTELRDGFAYYVGPDVSIDGLLTWQTDRFASVQVLHEDRAHGESNYSTRKLVRHALTMITAFSTRPLRLATTTGFFVIAFGIVVLAYVTLRLLIEGHSVPGFPFLASIISIFAGAQLFSIGVIGEYLARVHVRVMARPSYAIRATVEGPTSRPTTPAPSPVVAADIPLAPCERLAWDSAFWGFPIARVTAADLDRPTAARVAAWCDGEGIGCAFLLLGADDADSAAAAESVGFAAVDTRIALRRQPGPGAGDDRDDPTLTIREARGDDEQAVVDLARGAHTDTRFFFDTRFSADRARELYATWVRRGFGEDGRHLLVAEREGQILGYVLVDEGPPAIDLIAVLDSARGQGVGRALVTAAVAERPVEPIGVITQARNVAALRLYQASGFQIASTESWYHRWP